MVKTLHVYGALEKLLGTAQVKLDAETPEEMLRAIGMQVPEAAAIVRESDWHVMNGPLESGVQLHADELGVVACPEVHLIPATEGGNGSSMILVGAALIGAAFFPPLAGTMLATSMIGAGAGLMAGGVASMLVKAPRTATANSGDSSESTSYMFGGTSGTTQQGKPVPLTYGEDLVEPIIVSTSITAEEYTSD